MGVPRASTPLQLKAASFSGPLVPSFFVASGKTSSRGTIVASPLFRAASLAPPSTSPLSQHPQCHTPCLSLSNP